MSHLTNYLIERAVETGGRSHDRGFIGIAIEDRPGYLATCPQCGGIGGVPVQTCCRGGAEFCGDTGCSGPDAELEPCDRCETTGDPLPLCGRCQTFPVRDGTGTCAACRRAAIGPVPFIIVDDDDLPF